MCAGERGRKKREANKDQSVFLFERFVLCSVEVFASSLRLHRGIVGKCWLGQAAKEGLGQGGDREP